MHPLWPHKFSWPMVDGADSFYNQLVGINSSGYSAPDADVDESRLGKFIPVIKYAYCSNHAYTQTHALTHAYTYTHTHSHTQPFSIQWTAQTLL